MGSTFFASFGAPDVDCEQNLCFLCLDTKAVLQQAIESLRDVNSRLRPSHGWHQNPVGHQQRGCRKGEPSASALAFHNLLFAKKSCERDEEDSMASSERYSNTHPGPCRVKRSRVTSSKACRAMPPSDIDQFEAIIIEHGTLMQETHGHCTGVTADQAGRCRVKRSRETSYKACHATPPSDIDRLDAINAEHDNIMQQTNGHCMGVAGDQASVDQDRVASQSACDISMPVHDVPMDCEPIGGARDDSHYKDVCWVIAVRNLGVSLPIDRSGPFRALQDGNPMLRPFGSHLFLRVDRVVL